MRGNPDGANTRTTPAMRDTESLVQVEMTDIGPELRGRTMANKGIQIGPVYIDLPAGCMNNVTQLDNGFLEHAMR